jgi:hypothetical protein
MDLAQAHITGSGNNLHVNYGDDKGLLVEFVEDAVEQPFESEKAGRAIYKSMAFLSIIYPGDKTKRTYRPATDVDKRRFGPQWASYEKGEKAVENGTPITQWNYLSKSQSLELKHMGFWTVELLANASDNQISGLMSGHLLRKQAQEFLAVTKDDSRLTALVAENERLTQSHTLLGEQYALLKSRLDNIEDSEVKRPGRPRKED